MSKKLFFLMILIAFVVGAAGNIFFNRFVFPRLSTVKGFAWVGKLQSNAPIVINRREEVRLNEGVNLIELTKQAQTVVVSIYSSITAGSTAVKDQKFLGNGLIITSDGIIFTTKDVVGNNTQVTVVIDDGRVLPGLVRALDPKSPLVAITVTGRDLPVAQFSDAGIMQTAQRIFSLGRTNQEFTRIFASGMVTKTLSNNIDEAKVLNADVFENSLQTDAKLSADYIGGPVVNLQGLIIGMVVGPAGQILPAEAIDGALKVFLEQGKIQRPYFGFSYLTISKNLAAVKNLPQAGAPVTDVVVSGAAAKAGLLPLDLILRINDSSVADSSLEQLLIQNGSADMRVLIQRGPEQQILIIKPDIK